MAKQSTIKTFLPCASGGRQVMAVGSAQFVAKAKKVSIVVPFPQLDFGVAVPKLASVAGTSGSYLLWITSTMFLTKLNSYRVTISRRTGVVSALPFNYQMIGH
jgi:hypothetical protein